MRLWKILFGTPAALVVFVLLMPVRLQAEEEALSLAIAPRVQVSTKTEATHYRIDQLIPFKIVFTSDDVSSEPVFQMPELPLKNLSVDGTSQAAETRMEAGYQVKETILLYRLKSVKPGEACINSFSIDYKTNPDSMLQRVEIGPQCFDIQDLTWAAKIPRKIWILWGGIAGIAVCAAAGVVFARRRKQAGPVLSEEDQILADMDAAALNPADRANRAEILKQTAFVFRKYLSKRYSVATPNVGALQMLEALDRRRDISAEDKKAVRIVLEAITECTFGGVDPAADEILRIRDKVRTFIAGKKVFDTQQANKELPKSVKML